MAAKKLKKIMLVEDDVYVLDVAVLALKRKSDFEIMACKNGRQALAECAEFKPDLVLLDYMMPEMTGMEVLRRLKKNDSTKHIPVVLMTALGKDMCEDFMEVGAADVIYKPFNVLTLGDKICEIYCSIQDED